MVVGEDKANSVLGVSLRERERMRMAWEKGEKKLENQAVACEKRELASHSSFFFFPAEYLLFSFY